MKIVVTGALGHIGSSLIRRFAEALPGSEIIMIDDLSTQRYCSLFNLPSGVRYRFVEGDILKADLESLIKGAGAVVHLAAVTNAEGSFEISEHVQAVNCGGTIRVADACLKADVPLVFVSTTSVYGSQEKVVDEECPRADLKPQSPYAESKLKAEQYIQSLATSGLRSVVFRFGTIYGVSRGMRFHTAINKFCMQAVMVQPITVWRTAMDQYRPYLDLKDAVNAVIHVLKLNIFDARVYNVVSSNETVRSITDCIGTYVPGMTIKYVDTKIMNQLSYHVSCNRFLSTGFVSVGDLRGGIGETVSWLRNANDCGAVVP